MHWYTKVVLYRLAWLIVNEKEVTAAAKPIAEVVQSSRSGGKDFLEWALDFRSLVEQKAEMDRHFLQGKPECKRTPRSIWKANKRLWREVMDRGLDKQGQRVRAALWGEVQDKNFA